MKEFLLATVSMVALTSVARAADMPAAMPSKSPMYSPAPVAAWDGAYFGVQGGVVRRDAFFKEEFGGIELRLDGSKTGGAAGVLLGYSWQQGWFVYGLEGDWSWIGARASATHLANAFNSVSYDVNWLATIRGRVGVAVDSTLFYMTGGAAFGHVKDSVAILGNNGSVGLSFTQDQTRAGWTIGAGVEHMFAPQWSARAEFRYVNLGKTTVDCAPGTQACTPGYRGEFSNALMMGLVGLNYKFGASRSADWSQARAYAPPSLAPWTGGYLGIQGGVAHQDALFNNSDGFFIGASLIDRKKTGGTAGGLLGYNWQQGSFVYGVEGDWSWIGAKTSQLGAIDLNDTRSISFDVNWLATLRGRAGLAFDATLFYVTGGVALGHIKNSVELIFTPSERTASFSQNQTKVGWTAGVGAEYMLSQHWTARAEFRYVDLGKTTVSCGSTTNLIGCVSFDYRGEFSNTLKLGLVGLNYKF
jgi:outer membrane immunogenic protein